MTQEKNNEQGLIWVQEAIVKYAHSRQWFNRRIDSGRIRTAQIMGSTKVMLVEEDVKREHDKGEND